MAPRRNTNQQCGHALEYAQVRRRLIGGAHRNSVQEQQQAEKLQDRDLDGRLAFAVGNANNQISVLSASSPLVTGEVLHVAGTLNDVTGEQKLYINASEVASTTTDIRPFATLDSGFDPGLGIGNTQNSDWDQWFNGTIGQVRISDQALIPNEFLPEPATLLLLGLGGLMLRKRHRR